MNDAYERLKARLTFDPLDFDTELIELPGLIMEASELCAERVAQRDRCKNALDLAEAAAADFLRQNLIPDSKGGGKQRSEAQIGSELLLDKEVQEAVSLLEEAKFNLALWQALCDGLRTKRDSLRVYADLTISGYLSTGFAVGQRKAEMNAGRPVRRRPVQDC